MSLYAVWVHGNVARAERVGDPPIMQAGGIPWTDIVGAPGGRGITFRGRDRSRGPGGSRVVPQPSTFFHLAVPTPVIARNQRARLIAVFVLWKADPGIALQEVRVHDGPRAIPVAFPGPVGGGRTGEGGVPADLVPGMTRFDVPSGPEVLFGVGITLGYGFSADGQVEFYSAGADFEVPD